MLGRSVFTPKQVFRSGTTESQPIWIKFCSTQPSSQVDGAPAAVDQLSTCLANVEAWLKASLLRLNPDKTQVMWLGSQQLLSRLDIADVSVLSRRCFGVGRNEYQLHSSPGDGP